MSQTRADIESIVSKRKAKANGVFTDAMFESLCGKLQARYGASPLDIDSDVRSLQSSDDECNFSMAFDDGKPPCVPNDIESKPASKLDLSPEDAHKQLSQLRAEAQVSRQCLEVEIYVNCHLQ